MSALSSTEDMTSNANTAGSISPCKELWFDDGNIVLIAGKTSFRVHRSLLARHSPVLSDILSIPRASDPSSTQVDSEGCSVIQLSDSSDDIRCLLSILYDFGDKCFDRDVVLPFATVSSMLTIGMKYQIDRIAGEAIRRLKICFPTKLEDFYDNWTFGDNNPPPDHFVPIHMSHSDAIDVVRLAIMFDLISVLPAAFYKCAQLLTWDLFQAVSDRRRSLDTLRTCIDG
ncbi:hypothetical protein C8Q75DRAFT_806630 [Abortiporus biennis]|nr:hypothetical protein C8Q75DRAFT_806630 [Abortiporus biennis]